MTPDPHVRQLGRVEDIHGIPVTVGVDYDAVTINAPGTCQLSREATEELAHLIVAASWEAGDHAGRVAGQL